MARLSEHARKLLTGRNFGHLATVMEDGSPQVSPVWVDADDGHVLVNTALGRLKERNMRRDPRVGLSVLDHDAPYDKVHIRGRVVEMIEGDEAWDHIDALHRRYRATAAPYPRRPGQERVKVRIEPTALYEGP